MGPLQGLSLLLRIKKPNNGRVQKYIKKTLNETITHACVSNVVFHKNLLLARGKVQAHKDVFFGKKRPPHVYSFSAICRTFVETNKPFWAQQSGNQRLCCNNLPKSQLFTLRTVSPKLPEACAAKRDAQVWRCFSRIWGVTEATTPASAKFIASLPLSKGGLGLRSAVRSRSRPQMRARRLP